MLERGFTWAKPSRRKGDESQVGKYALIDEPGDPNRSGPIVFDRTSETEFHNKHFH